MSPRIPCDQVAEQASLVDASAVAAGDLRVLHLNEGACRAQAESNPDASFVLWPDGAIGFVVLVTAQDDPSGVCRGPLLLDAYAKARVFLEWLHLQLFSVLDDSGMAQ